MFLVACSKIFITGCSVFRPWIARLFLLGNFRHLHKLFLRIDTLQLVAYIFLNIWKVKGILLAGKTDGNSAFSGASGAADTVYIIFRIIGKVGFFSVGGPLLTAWHN
jgi:hypothetical protein